MDSRIFVIDYKTGCFPEPLFLSGYPSEPMQPECRVCREAKAAIRRLAVKRRRFQYSGRTALSAIRISPKTKEINFRQSRKILAQLPIFLSIFYKGSN